MEILKQIGWALLNTVEMTFWTIKLLITKLVSFVHKNLLPVNENGSMLIHKLLHQYTLTQMSTKFKKLHLLVTFRY